MKAKKQQDARVQPHSVAAEQSVLGCAIMDQDACFGIMSQLKKEDFYLDSHKIIFDSMYDLYSHNTPVEYVTLIDILEKNAELEEVGGYDYILSLTTVVPSASNYQHYVELVKRDSVLRSIISASNDIINYSYDATDKQEAIDYAESNIFKIGTSEERGGLSHVKTAVNGAIDEFERLQKEPNPVKGIPSGLYALDKITNGFKPGALIIVGARPGFGKTSLGMNMIVHAATECKKKCAIFSLEMSKEEIASRAICSLAYVDMAKANTGKMSNKEWEAVLAAAEKLSGAEMYIDEGFAKTPMDILSKCRKLKREKGLDLLMIDYLQLMQGSDRSRENRTLEIGEITRTLKMAARELNIPIILLSQLSRGTEGRAGNHRPTIADLRESGSIEQDADIVIFIYRSDMYNDVPDAQKEKDVAELIVAKNRAGSLDTAKVRWIGNITSFVNFNKDADAQSLESSMPEYDYVPPVNDSDVPPAPIPLEPLQEMDLVDDIFSDIE